MKDCVICGIAAQSGAEVEEWWQDVRFIHFDLLPSEGHPVKDHSSPCITGPGKIRYSGADDPNQACPYLRIPHIDGKSHYVLLPSRIFGCKYSSPQFSIVSACYPIHCFCWEMFTSISGVGVDSYPKEKIKILYRILGSLKFVDAHVIWEHGYDGGHGTFPVSYGPSCNDPTVIPDPDYWLLGDEIYQAARIDASSKGPALIPSILDRLPPEIIHIILSHLGLQDLTRLTKIKSIGRYEVPDILWKGFFDVRSDLGFLSSPAGMKPEDGWFRGFMASGDTITWRSLCILGQRYLISGPPSVSNRKRIWNLCIRLSNLVDEIHDSEKLNFKHHVDYPFLGQRPLVDLFLTAPDDKAIEAQPPFIVQTIEPQDMQRASENFEDMWAVSTRGSTAYVVADEIGVAFSGEEKLQYVSGLCFFHQGSEVESIGLIGRKRMRRVSVSHNQSFSIAAAVNHCGIVDISIAKGSEFVWLGGGKNIERAAIATRKFHTLAKETLNGIYISVVADFEAYKLKRLGIFSPHLLLRNQDLDFTCNSAWLPRPPIESVTKSLNVSSFCGIRDYLNVPGSHDTAFSTAMFLQRTKSGPVKPFSYIDFDNQLPDRFTCWIESHPLIAGISFSVTDEDGDVAQKWVLGYERGVPIDFPMNSAQGERVRFMEVKLTDPTPAREIPAISGITLYTTCRRRFQLVLASWPRGLGTTTLMPQMGYKITGLYGRSGWVPHLRRSGIIGLGIISTADATIQSSIPPPNLKSIKRAIIPQNAQYGAILERSEIDSDGPKDLVRMFICHVDMTDCSSISVYVKSDAPDARYMYHITGLALRFHGQKDKELSGNPIYLGRISPGDCWKPMELDVANGERLEKIGVFSERMDREFMIIAMEFHTTFGRKWSVGNWDCTGGVAQEWDLGLCNNLVWAFNKHSEWIKGFKSKEEWWKFCERLGTYEILLP